LDVSSKPGFEPKTFAVSTGFATPPFYKWKAKYGGMTVSETARLRTLEDENRRLKKLVADAVVRGRDPIVFEEIWIRPRTACVALHRLEQVIGSQVRSTRARIR
jgi:hypothetical protein